MRALTLGWLGLLGLLAVSVWVGFLPLDRYGWLAGVGIALVKAVVVAFVFMGYRKFTWESKAAAWAGGLWLTFLFGLILVDYVNQ